VTLVHGVELRLERDRIALFVDQGKGSFEPETVAAFLAAIVADPDGSVIDVGAYTGLFTILALQAGAREVIALEPNPSGYLRLIENLGHNGFTTGHARVMNVAAGAFRGTGSMEITDERKGICSTGKLRAADPSGPTKIVTIDRLAPRRRVSLIKIDVEGHEPFVLLGAALTIERYHPTLIVEVESGSGGDRAAMVGDLLDPYGYVGRRLDGRNMIYGRSP
jgi:FkbM family methyltransferase